VIPANSNMSAKLINKLLESGHQIYRSSESFEHRGNHLHAGAFIVEKNGNETAQTIRRFTRDFGVDIYGLNSKPSVESYKLNRPNIAMYQSWTANIDEGWTRWVFDNYGFEYTTLRDEDIRSGDLSEFDLVILPAQAPGHQSHLSIVEIIYMQGLLLLRKMEMKQLKPFAGSPGIMALISMV